MATDFVQKMEIALRVHVVVWRISSNISDILDRFSQYFHHMKALYVPMMDLYLIFQFLKGRCHGNQIKFRNEGKLILRAFFARSPDVSTVSFRYYLLGGDTVAPSRLLARLCHAFLATAEFQFNYLSL